MELSLLLVAVVVGCLLAVQTSANLQLTTALGTPYGASTVQLGLALALLVVAALAVGATGAVGDLGSVPAWHLLGGLASPLYITSGILLFPRLGALVSVGLFVAGQMFASLGLDLAGALGVPQRPWSVGIVVGAALVLAGIVLVIRAQRAAAPGSRAAARAGWILLGLVAGAVLPVQGAVNARLRADVDEPLAVAALSFAVATATIGVVLALLLVLRRTPVPSTTRLPTMPWWGWLGGICAAVYVTATFLLIPEIGAATTVALTVTGQQLASAVIDQRGLFRLPRRPLDARRVAGLLLLLTGSIAIQLG
ncbi:DMT family transporter [Cryptosporangium aurantiacum]|uniref:Transporter family-2 protein n=1 Tax=Cryptosporangium aurantiacum TaxID=134849 RepID=A0A1M7TVS3_9ACTN|nr:DMT family transporter [Cryptosporangium aurantiacum]SHN74826.1 transporter family-2 protein [Cryptosporangium aurantiacum]